MSLPPSFPADSHSLLSSLSFSLCVSLCIPPQVVFFLAHPSLVKSPHLRASLGDVLYKAFLPRSERNNDDPYGKTKRDRVTLCASTSKYAVEEERVTLLFRVRRRKRAFGKGRKDEGLLRRGGRGGTPVGKGKRSRYHRRRSDQPAVPAAVSVGVPAPRVTRSENRRRHRNPHVRESENEPSPAQ